MLNVLDRKSLEAHDNFLARRLVVMAWCYRKMIDDLPPAMKLILPMNFFVVGENLIIIADVMWQEHGDWAYQQRLADIEQVASARYN